MLCTAISQRLAIQSQGAPYRRECLATVPVRIRRR